MKDICTWMTVAFMACAASAFPTYHSSSSAGKASYEVTDVAAGRDMESPLGSRLASREDREFPLRIAPLGASIINGVLSSDGNGFRKYLHNLLCHDGWQVKMVGSVKSGTMDNNENEGHPGWTIQQVTNSALPNIVPDQPNLVLINVGTNNAIQNNGLANVANLYIQLLDRIFDQIEDTVVILSTLLPNKNATTDSRCEKINDAIRTTVVSHYTDLNKPVFLADMNTGLITRDDLNDSTHPTDAGYQKMATVWWHTIQQADEADALRPPPEVDYE